jgi:arylsulfatase A-like enzyme
MNLDEKTIGDTFKASGYATGAFGKWHNGTQFPYHPNARGFDEYYGFCSGHWGHYFDTILDHNGRRVRGSGYVIDDFTNHALQFIEENRDNSFFCYLPYNTPHSPMQVPDHFWKGFEGKPLSQRNRDPEREEIDKTRAALAMCENIDWNVGRVLEKLEALGLAEDTIVIYFADNGPNSWRWNGGMKGRKGSVDEGGVRVPCLIRWPGKIPAGHRIPEIASAIDFLPTLADMAGIPVVSTKPLDGINIKPLLLGTVNNWPDRMIFNFWKGVTSVRTQQYRLDTAGQLFDIDADPGQDHDISKEKSLVANKLKAAAARMNEEMKSFIGRDDRPFLVGYPGAPNSPLPARDGIAHGNIKRTAGAPNCSFFTNWISTEDKITWDVEVLETGRYDAVIYYTCAEQNTGVTMELRFKGSAVKGKVTEAHDPPEVGKSFDRSPRRGEAYVKNFHPFRLGSVRLDKGRGKITLRALDIPGQAAIDVRLIELVRKG